MKPLIDDDLKICSRCGIKKPKSDYNLHSKKKPILKPYCKDCQSIYDKEYKNTYFGLITAIYKSLKSSSIRRNHPQVEFSKQEFTKWLTDNKYDEFYKNWADSGFYRYKRPSVDRLEDNKHYFFNNMRLTTWYENDKKYKDSVKYPVIIENIETGEKLEYESIRLASRVLNIHHSTINSAFRGNRLFHGIYKITKIDNT